MADNVIAFDNSTEKARRRVADSRVRRIVQLVRNQMAGILPRLMQDLFEHLDDELYKLADRSDSDALQSRYFDAMRELRKLRGSIEKDFLQSRFLDFDHFWEERTPANLEFSEQDELEMSLIEDEDLEEDLAISALVSKSENRYHRELFALNLRFGALLGVKDLNDERNPIGPRALAEGFSDALAHWQGETSLKLLIYKLFDRYVMAYVGALYDEVNDLLVAEGVLPKIVQRVRRNPVAPSIQRARDPQHADMSPEPPEASGDAGAGSGGVDNQGLLNALVNMLSQQGPGNLPASARRWSLGAGQAPTLPEVSTGDLMTALSQVQSDTLRAAPVDVSEVEAMQSELISSLGQELDLRQAGQPRKRLVRADQDMLEVMGLLFDFILGDKNLPEAMKALIGRLQIPLVKVALKDRGFFSNPHHPARLLLNNLARAGVAWNDDGDRSPNSPYGQIETAVTRVLTDFVDDISVFESVNEEFTHYLDHERRNAEVAEERVSQVKRGQEQLELARKRVVDVIKGYRESCSEPGCLIPEAVTQLLNEAWNDVLLLAYLREGEDSNAWQSATEVVQQLIWSVQPKSEQAERQKLLKSIPELLKRVREGLVNISFDQHRSAILFKNLQACHIAALRGVRVESTGEPAATGGASATTESAGDQGAASPQPVEDQFHEIAEQLSIGNWLEWLDDHGEWVRGKLSWRSEVTKSCIFVNRKGLKIAEMSVLEIADRLRNERARPLQDIETPLMDRALDAMLDVLRRSAPADAPQPA